ncbi:MAG TPA: ankyrin repeat domain-containing protein, partial [Aquabacterium sp.]|nr:ankyrin repeat domain-containing protein [Aquabacterium sp.]
SDEQIDAIVWLTVTLGSCLMLAGMLHVLTRQWLIGIEAGSWWLDRSSAWRRQRHVLPPRDASSLQPRHVYTTSPGTIGVQHHHRVELYSPPEGTMAISPALPSRAMALGLIDQLSLAQAPAAGASLPAEWATHAPPDTVWRARHRVVNWCAWILLSTLILALSTRAEDHLGSHPTAAWQSWRNALLAQGELVLGIGLKERALLRAIDGDRDEDVESALRQGAHPDTTGERGSSALMLAATRGKLSTVNLLLAHGADVQFVNQTSVNERGDTALLRAAYFGHAEVFQRLIEAGARTDVRNRWDWTPVHMASMGGCLPCLAQLRARGLSLNARATASRGESPLMLAAA